MSGEEQALGARIPRWARAALALDRAATALERAHASLRDELFLAWIPPEERLPLTAALYAKNATFKPGGERFEQGLFPWEARIVSGPEFPKRGRLLVGAAGGGREALALLERGYEVVAFEPSDACLDAKEIISSRFPRARTLRGAYEDLPLALEGRGPLGELSGQAFDAVVLGWGSLSHVMPPPARAELFRALGALAPGAPVLASFMLARASTRSGRTRAALRGLFRALGAPGTSRPGEHFASGAGFFVRLEREELFSLAREGGFEVERFEERPYPHALFVPARVTRAAGAEPRAPSVVACADAAGAASARPRGASTHRAPDGEAFRIPPWVKAFLRLDALVRSLENVHASLRDELFLAWVRPEERLPFTAALHAVNARSGSDELGGERFERGLFPWDAGPWDAGPWDAGALPGFPERGRLLVGAAGGGREARALRERGYEVVAMDPSGPLGGLSGQGFDAIVLGWGGLSRISPSSARGELLRALRALAPEAPVLVSFAQMESGPSARSLIARGSKGRVRDALRWAFDRLGAPGVSRVGEHFHPASGFVAWLAPGELVRIASEAGYEVRLLREGAFSHALLAPSSPSRQSASGPPAAPSSSG